MPRESRAGSRTNRYRVGYGRIGDNRVAWLRTMSTGQLVLAEIDSDAVNEEAADLQIDGEAGYTYLLNIFIPGRKNPLRWNFSAMTQEELEKTRQFFNHLFDLADPVVRERDRIANEAFKKGDDSYARIYRPVPQLVTRERPKRQHDPGVLERPGGAAEGTGSGSDFGGGLPAGSGELADSQPQDSGLQDDGSEDHES